ncbi:SH3 domain-containing protein [Ruegeria sp. HKCCA5491]|uniref:SH3 domain-containing protein n=1 Tax=Ruegeria sp. HKCCA5491 TaxID=2682986 RepID=UPI001489B626|nr:SH3 domain-containing protein [Ruegeria sp. HKCCA5491]
MKPLLLVATFTCGPALADRQTFPPVDEADQDPSLLAFRAELLTKVKARDADAVIAAACPDIYLSHGGNGGPEEFRELLAPDPATLPEQGGETYWSDLENTLLQPGYFDEDGEFWMPHQWQITLPATLDPYMAYFVNAADVTLRQSPNRGAPILDLISHEVVIVRDYSEIDEYQQVLLTDGGQGYMHSMFLWPMVGYRAAFAKSEGGQWQLCTFVAGD